MKHYDAADFIELHYLGDEAPEMREHLAECPSCTAEFERVAQTLRNAAGDADVDVPETFWSRQKLAVLRRIRAERRAWWRGHVAQFAVAAMLVIIVGGGWLLIAIRPAAEEVRPAQPTQTAALAPLQPVAVPQTPVTGMLDEFSAAGDPWDSEHLQPFRDVVAWESWVIQNDAEAGGTL